MFTGIIQSLGRVTTIQSDGDGGFSLLIQNGTIAANSQIGESIAVNGVCLTITKIPHENLLFQIGPETVLKSNLGDLHAGDFVNLEQALKIGDRLGGHFVQGHVDGIGHIESRTQQGSWEMISIRCPEFLTKYMVEKGSIAVDGISLTLVRVNNTNFEIMLIPHTLDNTTLGQKKIGDRVNLETDMLAKHVAKLLGK